jgi:hypothetical protein
MATLVGAIVLVLDCTLVLSADYREIQVPAQAYRSWCSSKVEPLSSQPDDALPCTAKGGLVSCDFSGAEPVDVDRDVVCYNRVLRVKPAPRASIYSPQPVTVEWLAVESGAVTVVATRRANREGTLNLIVSRSNDRLVRFVREGRSPVTVSAEELFTGSYSVPAPTAGGELLLQVGDRPVRPKFMRVAGNSGVGETVAANKGVVGLPGLPQGEYLVTPIYDGGVAGRQRQATVRPGQSTYVSESVDNVGGIRIEADGPLCNDVRGVLVDQMRGPKNGIWVKQALARLRTAGECLQTIAGLSPGRYQVAVQGADGILFEYTVNVRTQQISVLRLRSSVSAYGMVLLDATAVSGLNVEFTLRREGVLYRASTVTDATGAYSLTLPEPGTYSVTFRQGYTELMNQTQRASVGPGQNSLNWFLEGGTLELYFKGWEGATPLEVTVSKMPLSSGVSAVAIPVRSGQRQPLIFTGFGFGTYEVRCGLVGEPPTSNTNVVTFSEEVRRASVVLDLRVHP